MKIQPESNALPNLSACDIDHEWVQVPTLLALSNEEVEVWIDAQEKPELCARVSNEETGESERVGAVALRRLAEEMRAAALALDQIASAMERWPALVEAHQLRAAADSAGEPDGAPHAPRRV